MLRQILEHLLMLERAGRVASLEPLFTGLRLQTSRGPGVVDGGMLLLDSGVKIAISCTDITGFASAKPAPVLKAPASVKPASVPVPKAPAKPE